MPWDAGVDAFRLGGVLALLALILWLEPLREGPGSARDPRGSRSAPPPRRAARRVLRALFGLVFVGDVALLCATLAQSGGRLAGADLVFAGLLVLLGGLFAGSLERDFPSARVLRRWHRKF